MEQDMAGEPMSGAQIIIKALVDQGVDVVFGYPGGAVLPIYDALFKQNELRHILVRQEGGAVHAAEGYARSTGKVGVVLVTSGPGATNAVTGLTDALMDSVPVVCLTGQVPTHLIGNDAFQECDTTGITRPCTKHNYLVKDPEKLAKTLHEAFFVARSGRPGPVVVDIPKDIQFAECPYVGPSNVKHKTYRPQVKGDRQKIERAVEMIAKAKRPVIYGGGGIINSGPKASKLFTQFVKMTGAPTTLTLMGLGALPASDERYLGMVGMHGTYEANLAMHECDVMICIAARFDDRVTGRLDAFAPGARKIHIDIDPTSINKNVAVDLGIVGDVANVLEEMIAIWKAEKKSVDKKAVAAWWKKVDGWRKRDSLKFKNDSKRITPDVGGPALPLREAQPLDDLGRARHHGLRAARRDRHAAWPSGRAGGGHRRRGLDHDEHPGDRHRRPVPAAGQAVHHQQRVYGHGPPVAGAAARRALFRELFGGPAGFRQAGRELRCHRPAGNQTRRAGRRHQDDDRDRRHGDRRHCRRSEGELLPDDPVGGGP
jgi:thiamine pyrophosphate-dependent acetolactate synthase large subunit-like protein